ncbi:MAG TPA: hypothetical protein VK249_07670 [Anaerolineales bacterium]|nr:hypothetical protein [Anaerolineales bacterium]
MYPKGFVIKRILLSIVLGLILGTLISEVPFLFLRETARAPRAVILNIPAGTAEQIALGKQPPSIPENMTFVVGDRLVVNNEDSVDHKLGPLWIPAHSKAQLALDQEANFAYECSFQAGKVFGLDVREPLTASTRIFGIIYVAFPLAILIALYGLLFPPKKKENAPA